MMTVHITCSNCGSAVNIYPTLEASSAECGICQHKTSVQFTPEHHACELKSCPVCQRKDFYQQKDFNRKIGVFLFVVAAILTPWTYGISLIVLFLIDWFLFKRISNVCICYKCKTIFREVKNLKDIPPYDHEMNDRIVYSDHDFQGKPLKH